MVCCFGRQIGASSSGMYWNSVLTKGGSTLVCLCSYTVGPFMPDCYKFGSECFLGIIIPEKKKGGK